MEIFSDRVAAKSQWKFVFQKTCSIYSTMVLFLVRGNINIFIRSILDHFWYLLRTLNQFQDKIHDLFKICRLKITFSSILTKYLKILEDSLCSLPTKITPPIVYTYIWIISTNYHDKAKQNTEVFFRIYPYKTLCLKQFYLKITSCWLV